MTHPCKNEGCKNSVVKSGLECSECREIGTPGSPLRIACDDIGDLYGSWGNKNFVVASIIRKYAEKTNGGRRQKARWVDEYFPPKEGLDTF